MATQSFQKSKTLSSGPWKSVRSTTDPFDDPPDQLTDAINGYIPDPDNGSGFYQRPAFVNSTSDSTGQTETSGQWHFTSSSTGTEINFETTLGKLYRVTTGGTKTDVTPVGVTIDPAIQTRVFFQQLNDQLIVTDGVHRPWIGTNLSSTPITGTYIDIDGAGTLWTAFGGPTFFLGAIFFILKTVAAGSLVPRGAIVWCEPNQPAVGYTQIGYSDFWNLFQTSQRPITGILGTDTGIIVWRDQGIGLLQGTPNGSFSQQGTHQAISDEIGLVAPATIDRYLEHVFFCDQFGRPQMIVGATLQEPQIWLQMRQFVDANAQVWGAPTAVAQVAIGIIEPNLNLYICAPWSNAVSSLDANYFAAPVTAYAFDAKTGSYVGRWTVSGGATVGVGCGMTGFGIQRDINNAQQLWVIAQQFPVSTGTIPWMLKRLSDNSWVDDADGIGNGQTVRIQTGRLGYSADSVWDCGDVGNLVTMNNAAVQITVTTPYQSATVEGTPTPSPSVDGTFRCVVGMDVHAARGITVVATPTLGSTQWGAQRWTMQGIPSKAGREDA